MLAIPIACIACSKKATKLITNEADGWTFAMPAEFVQRSVALPKGISQYMGPDEDGYRANIVIESLPGNDSAEKVGTEIAKTPPAGLVIQEHGPYPLPTMTGYSVRGTRNKGLEGQRQVYLTDHGICVIFTITASSKTFDQWDQVLKESLQEFHWTKK